MSYTRGERPEVPNTSEMDPFKALADFINIFDGGATTFGRKTIWPTDSISILFCQSY
jgi:hypothetical protein